MAILRFISDSEEMYSSGPRSSFGPGITGGWLEVPTVDVAAAGVTPSRYSYIDATNGMTYLEEEEDATHYLDTVYGGEDFWEMVDTYTQQLHIDGLCWVRDLPPAA